MTDDEVIAKVRAAAEEAIAMHAEFPHNGDDVEACMLARAALAMVDQWEYWNRLRYAPPNAYKYRRQWERETREAAQNAARILAALRKAVTP